ncbi:protein of unknown function [Hyphomicrobium sp. MC1]|nr:protein of unknown function [Hyphomicrobium sp. MC1]
MDQNYPKGDANQSLGAYELRSAHVVDAGAPPSVNGELMGSVLMHQSQDNMVIASCLLFASQMDLVRTEGLEPSRRYRLRILSPVCLPVPPRPRRWTLWRVRGASATR